MTNPTPTSAAAMTDEQIDRLLDELHAIAVDFDKHEFGLPVNFDPSMTNMRSAVRRFLAQAASVAAQELEFDRDTDGELLIDWSPSQGRMLTLSLCDDGRLSYAVTWDGEKFHGQAQMPTREYATLGGGLLGDPSGERAVLLSELHAAGQEVLDAHEAEAKATSTAQTAAENYSNQYREMLAQHEAAVRASNSEKRLRAALRASSAAKEKL